MTDHAYPNLRRIGSRGGSRGRGLQATVTNPPGSAIAAFPRPLLCLPDADHVRKACDWCLRPGSTSSDSLSTTSTPAPLSLSAAQTKLSVCTRCRYVVYCSKKCQSAAWKAVHKLECPALCSIQESLLGSNRKKEEGKWFVPTPVRAAMQLLLRLKAGDESVKRAVGGIPSVGPGTGGETQGVLEANVEGFSRNDKVWKDLGTQAMATLKFAGIELDGDQTSAAAEEVRAVLCMLQTNAFDRRDEDVGAAGVFLDVDLAMANHSCVPNAYVCFVGRTALLRAEREVKAGEEIEISYVDNTLSKAERHKALSLYHFECQCRRCRDDLDVYQVCQSSPTVPLNIFSLQPDLNLYINPPINRGALPAIQAPGTGDERQHIWKCCKPLLDAKMYAIEPIPSILHDLVIRYSTQDQNFAYALSLACFLATQCHPYAHVAPFKPWRVKGLLMVAQLLSQTAPLSAMGELGHTCPNRALVDRLARMDQVSMCEVVLRLAVHYGPVAHSDDWEVVIGAKELLGDIQQLQGREQESAAIAAWAANPEQPEARHFVDKVVLAPVKELAGFALEIADRALKDDGGLPPKVAPASLRRLVYAS